MELPFAFAFLFYALPLAHSSISHLRENRLTSMFTSSLDQKQASDIRELHKDH